MPWFLAIPMIGGANGNRTLTPIAVLCWFAYTGHLPVVGTWAFWTTNIISVTVFTVLAIGELIGDKLPQTPDRIAIFPLIARAVFGGLVGAIIATTLLVPVVLGAGLGAVSAVAGAYLGFHLRRALTSGGKIPDLPVALVEDAVTLTLAVIALHSLTA